MSDRAQLVSAGGPIRWRIESTDEGRVLVVSPPPAVGLSDGGGSYEMSVGEARALALALSISAQDAVKVHAAEARAARMRGET